MKLRIKRPKIAMLYVLSAGLLLSGAAISWSGLHTGYRAVPRLQQTQQPGVGAPSTVKPSVVAVKNYAVASNVPKYLDIPKLKVHTRILSEGVGKQNELQVPGNIYDTGWYSASAQPGQNGAMLIDGHSGIGNVHGVFNKLANLAAGDPVVVTRGDGQKFTYTVVKVQMVNVRDVDMASMLVSADTSKPGLNLITCAGDQIPGTNELNQRVLAYAVMQ